MFKNVEGEYVREDIDSENNNNNAGIKKYINRNDGEK